MSKFELKLPQMGESVAEATLTSWLKEVGDSIEADEAVFEIATDKVDSEVPSEVDGVLLEKCFEVDDVIKVGQVVAVIEVAGDSDGTADSKAVQTTEKAAETPQAVPEVIQTVVAAKEITTPAQTPAKSTGTERFYSPLVRNMAREEGIGQEELDAIPGSGAAGRLTKDDMLAYIGNRKQAPASGGKIPETKTASEPVHKPESPAQKTPVPTGKGDEKIPMTRMGKLIAKHMTDSVATSAHVQSFVEVDVTNVVEWRNKVKDAFQKREGEKLTFTPIFMEAVAIALKKYPMMNIAVDGDAIIKRRNINLGMAAALGDGNLIVPVIKNADQLNLVGMAKAVNDLASRARNNALKPDEIQDGTYTVTNVGTFGSVFGTPIINQPQVGILALGAIRKIPSVIETPSGDFIGIRSKMFLSHSYDHRVVNGALGGMFVKSVADYLEAWDVNREI
ncbi:dihydrolipoamide acetyltransferase family protein [Robiginitalea aurantiaca]|uniref:Dihydrolipoamide acetyltransferase component of pyruvate dehydrogenase complex n=1 Tax=Robiginitalea aurantiaca TaxID=3056915 RepID=A0ABT7WGG4_9FLAO|nr:dihydrolipoamide acetyltransferase family protein [Robiginitalea aurantiaca]MDM9632014.1 dihydrolipoamide acetyltransferase family protein [Robiginitalea aurantiaca]